MRAKSFSGYLEAIAAYFLWGFTPLYWRQLQEISSLHLLIHRVFWGFVFAWVCIGLSRRYREMTAAALRSHGLRLAAAGVLLSVNWLVYIYSVNSGFLQDASLGYYINPLVSVFLGMVILRERLERLEWIALGLAIAGVVILTVQLGRFPWISFTLAVSFGTYGLIKKKTRLSSLTSQTWELTPILPLLLLLPALSGSGLGAFFSETQDLSAARLFYLSLSGPITVVPLILFSMGAQRINLSSIGFLQFIAPTMMLIISVAVFREPFPLGKLPGFILVWTALVLYTLARIKRTVPSA